MFCDRGQTGRHGGSETASIPGLLFTYDEVALVGSAAHQRKIRAICTNLSASRWLSYLEDYITPFPISGYRTRLFARKLYSMLLFKFLKIAQICRFFSLRVLFSG